MSVRGSAAYSSAVIHAGRTYGLYHSTTWSVGPNARTHRDRARPVSFGVFQRGWLGPPGREVDDPPLAHAEDAVEPAADEQGQVGERAERPVPDQDVAGAQFRVQQGDARHLVRPERRGEEVLEQAGAGVEQGQHPGDREAAASAPRSSGKEESLKLETFRRNPAGNQSRPAEPGQQPEASLAWWAGDRPCEA